MNKVLTLLLFISGCCVQAQTTFLSVTEAMEHTRKNNPSLKADQLQQEISHERLRSAWSALLPQVKAFGTFDNNVSLPVQLVPAQLLGGAEGEFIKVQFGTQYSSTYGAEASLSLVNVSNWKNIKSASLGEEIANYQTQDKELSLTEQTITIYYFALLSREAMLLNEELVNAADSLLTAAKMRLDNGLIEPLEFNRVKSLYLESLQNFKDSESSFQKNLDQLKTLSGLSVADSLILSEKIGLNPTSSPTFLAVTAEQLPRYRMLRLKHRQTSEDVLKNKTKVLPEVSLYGRAMRQTFSNEFNVFSSDQMWFDVAMVGIRAEWNLFSGFNRQSQIRQSTLQQKSAEFEFQNYRLQADKELEELTINHRVSAQGVQNYLEHYQLNAVNHRIAGEKYNQGIYSIDNYVTIYQERVRSQNLYLSKLASFLIYESMVQSRNALH
jgi:outer membrane protein TolC